MQLLTLKNLLRRRPANEARCFLHGELELLEDPVPARFPASLFALDRVVLRPQPAGLRYLLLSESIRRAIPLRFAQPFANASVVDHPYHFAAPDTTAHPSAVFGIFGNLGDGRLLEQVARLALSRDASVRIRLIGFLEDQSAADRLRGLVEDASPRVLPRAEFCDRAGQITHALWMAPTGGFRLRASGTFMDALSFGTPLVYTANPFIDGYVAEEPQLGIRCSSAEQVAEALVQASRDYTPTQHAASRAAIYRFRERFTPQSIASRLPAALDWD